MGTSPRDRRLRSDYEAMARLRDESTILRFECSMAPPDRYLVEFVGTGAWRDSISGDVQPRDRHVVAITLNAAYPRMIPEIVWRTPIFHPNISAGGVVCLGGYQTNWVPSLKLDELCTMLWDMIRFANYDVDSPYNRDAAIWAKQHRARFPLDSRPLRDRGVVNDRGAVAIGQNHSPITVSLPPADEIAFIEAEIVEPSPSASRDGVVFID